MVARDRGAAHGPLLGPGCGRQRAEDGRGDPERRGRGLAPGCESSVLLSVNYQPLRDDSGGVSGLVVSFSDISQRRTSPSSQAADERDFFQATLDSLTTQIAVLGAEGEIVMTNRAWAEFAATEDPALPVLGENYLAACDAADL